MVTPPAGILALDVGTSTTRAIAYSTGGMRLAYESASTPITLGQGGEATVDPEAVWSVIIDLCRRIGQQHRVRVRGVGVSAQIGIVFLDQALQPTSAPRLWCDTRAVAESEVLQGRLGEESVTIAGRMITSETTAAIALWLQRNEREAFAATRWIVSLKDYLVTRLGGSVCTDPAHASYTGLYDVRRQQWSEHLAGIVGIPLKMLPRVRSCEEIAGPLDDRVARLLGCDANIPIAVSGPDGSLGVLGAGGFRDGVTVDVAGSTDVLLQTTSWPPAIVDPRLVLNDFVAPGLWAIGGPTGLTGGAIGWLARLLGYSSVHAMYAAMASEVDAVSPGADGVSFYTAMTGERLPVWEPTRHGVILGLRPDHGAAQLVRAAEEGAAFAVRDAIDVIRSNGQPIQEVITVGGLASQPRTMQMRADILQCSIATVEDEEASAVGAAMAAGTAASVFRSLADAGTTLVHAARTYNPRPSSQEAMLRAHNHWQAARSAGGHSGSD